jgi:hypothetical protein
MVATIGDGNLKLNMPTNYAQKMETRFGGVDWVRVSQDRDQQRVLVNTAMDIKD